MTTKSLRLLLMFPVLLIASRLSAAVPVPGNYVVTPIVTLGAAAGINSSGQVTGDSWGSAYTVFLWAPLKPNATVGNVVDIGGLPLANLFGQVAGGINDFGQIVGITSTYRGLSEAFLWTPAAANATSGTVVAILRDVSELGGINNMGQIVGTQYGLGFIWTPSSPHATSGTLLLDARLSGVVAINDYGQAIMASSPPSLFTPSSPNGATGTFSAVAGLPGSTIDQVVAISKTGVILGYSSIPDAHGTAQSHGFLWTPAAPNASAGTSVEIPLPSGLVSMIPQGINAAGQVAGYMVPANSGAPTPFLYTAGNVYDLTALGTSLPADPIEMPAQINDRGQIAIGGVLLTPGFTPPASSPGAVAITMASSPSGQVFTVDGDSCSAGAYYTPQTLYWIPGSNCAVTFPSPHLVQVGERSVFGGWQDGPAANPRTFAAPLQPATYTAMLNTEYLVTATVVPSGGGTVTGTGWYPAGATANITATPSAGYELLDPSSATTAFPVIIYRPLTFTFALLSSIPPGNYAVTRIDSAGIPATVRPINNSGQVTGTAAQEFPAAFLWTPVIPNAPAGSKTGINGSPPAPPPPVMSSAASIPVTGINDFGQVAGVSGGQPFLWSPSIPNGTTGSLTNLFAANTLLRAINNYGQIAGVTNGSYFLWTPSTPNGSTGLTNIDPGLNGLAAINDFGQAVMNSTFPPTLFTPSTANGSSGTYTTATDVPGFAVALSSYGTVMGYWCPPSFTVGCLNQMFLWTPATAHGTTGVVTEVPLPANYVSMTPAAFNSLGQVIGMAQRADGAGIPFLYSGGNLYDLTTVAPQIDWLVSVPLGINDRGQIVVGGTLDSGTPEIYLLTPTAVTQPVQGSVGVTIEATYPASLTVSYAIAEVFTVSGDGCNPGAYETPQTLSWTPGARCTVTFPAPQSSEVGTRDVFSAWQDSAAGNSRVFTAPAQSATYIASFTHQCLIATAANPTSAGTVSGGGWLTYGTVATITAAPAAGYRVADWGSASGTINGNTIAITVYYSETITADFAPTTATLPYQYQFAEIGEGFATTIKPINNYGQVVGTNGSTSALLWTPSNPTSLEGSWSTIPGLPAGARPYHSASGINNQGQVAGITAASVTSKTAQPFLWTPAAANGTSGTTYPFVTNSVGGPTALLSINNYGQIANGESGSAFLWTPSPPGGSSGTLNSDTRLTGLQTINDFGQAIINNSAPTATLFTPSAANGTNGTFSTVYGLPGAIATSLVDINNNGTILGVSCVAAGGSACLNHMFVWTPPLPNSPSGTAVEIPAPAGFMSMTPTAVNSQGEAVGVMTQSSTALTTPFLYSGGTVYDLSEVDGSLRTAIPAGINDRREIILNEGTYNGTIYLLTTHLVEPEPSDVSPAAGNGASQAIALTFNDPRGWQDLDVLNVLINSVLDGRNACYVAYSVQLNVLYLVNDAGTALLPGITLSGSSASVSNSQCSVSAVGSPTQAGDALTLTLSFTFTPGFAGNKIIYMAARDIAQNNSGWQSLGTWGVPGAAATGPTAAVSVSPPHGTGSSHTFTFTFSDTKGWQDLGVVDILINDSLDGRNACYLAYSHAYNMLYLVNDAGTGLSQAPTLGTYGSVNNSQCTILTSGSSATGNGNILTITLNINFATGFRGHQVIYLAARDLTDTNNSGWQAMGSWTVQ